MVRGVYQAIQEATGHAPDGCPWRAFFTPVVRDTLHYYPWFESGQLEFALGADPPHRLVEALRTYHIALQYARQHQQQLERRARERSRGG